MTISRACLVAFSCMVGLVWAHSSRASAAGLEERLAAEAVSELVADAREFGDPARGAVVFYQPALSCTRCHLAGDGSERLGPDLTRPGPVVSDEHLVDSVLRPSAVIREGFAPVTLVKTDGSIVSGLMISESPEAISLRDSARDFKQVKVSRSDVVQVGRGDVSIMPKGQLGLLSSRQQFLDLIAYLRAIRDGGASRAAELEPAPSLWADRPPPEYEKRIDHAGILKSLDKEARQRGQAIYERLCVNCHGTHEEPGSLPTSLRFAKGQFKNGSDPYTMYRTLTHGFGMMVAQTWMVPTQKYDVIHYIREAYLKEHNPSQYFEVSAEYLAGLPEGDTRGPAPSKIEPWAQMDYGPNLVLTLEVGRGNKKGARNIAYKGNAIRLDAGPGGVTQGRHWLLYDYDTMRVAAVWSGQGFIDFNGINFNGRHGVHPRVVGDVHLENPIGPGWGHPETGNFEDTRLVGRDDRIYGPLPRDWAHYKGMYYHGPDTILRYTVGETEILERPGLSRVRGEGLDGMPVFRRSLDIAAREKDLLMQFAHRKGAEMTGPSDWGTSDEGPSDEGTLDEADAGGVVVFGSSEKGPAPGYLVAGMAGDVAGFSWVADSADLRLRIPAGAERRRVTLWFASVDERRTARALAEAVVLDDPAADLGRWTHGGPARWPASLRGEVEIGDDDGPFAVDVLRRPTDNPWFCRMRWSGIDFSADGDRAWVCSWDGSVWLVSGLSKLPAKSSGESSDAVSEGKPQRAEVTWRRVASGLFQPLGLKVIEGKVFVTCRDQICVLHDLNGDQEIDWYESFNNDHQVTDHFHEFAMGLQADDEGNLYYAKSARHAKTALVPHHGTLLRVSKDGRRTDILANGFRAANGVCLNPDGTFIVTDQEGHWNPKNRINYVKVGGFYGNMFGYHDVEDSSDSAMEQPLCWITNAFDRSPSELLWVDSKAWGPLDGHLLNLSYGYGKVYIVPHETVDGQQQGGMCEFPIPRFPTGTMRGRFHPGDGQLWVCGMSAWGSNQGQAGGLYRIRRTDRPVHLPTELRATKRGLEIGFSGELASEAASDPGSYRVKVWGLVRSASYGSKHIDEHAIEVAAAELSKDGRTVLLSIPEIAPTWSMEIRYELETRGGETFRGKIHSTIHKLGGS